MYNILFISSWYPTRLQPTNGDFVQIHAKAIASLCRVFVLHICYDNKTHKHEIHQNIQANFAEIIFYLKEPHCKIAFVCKCLKAMQLFFMYFKALRYMRKKLHFIPDIVHANVLYPIGVIAFCFKLFAGIPYVVSEHWTAFLTLKTNKIAGFPLFVSKWVARFASCVMPVTEHLQKSMKSLGIHAKYRVVSNIIDIDLFKKTSYEVHEPYRFIHVSNGVEAHKNIQGIIDATTILSSLKKEFELHILCREEYSNQIPQIYFHGKKTHQETAELMKKCDCLVHFSNYETFSIVMAESLACGNPVITSRCGGLSNELGPDYAVLVPPKDINALTQAMFRMINHHSQYNPEKLRDYAVTHFSKEKIAGQFLEIYKSVKRSQ
ncbi:MAG: glycosyltransferase [Bacteroidales bacterium]